MSRPDNRDQLSRNERLMRTTGLLLLGAVAVTAVANTAYVVNVFTPDTEQVSVQVSGGHDLWDSIGNEAQNLRDDGCDVSAAELRNALEHETDLSRASGFYSVEVTC